MVPWPKDLDSAVLDRMDEAMEFALPGLEAGAYTRPLFSSTRAVFGTKKNPHHYVIPPKFPYTAPKQPLNVPPIPQSSAHIELKSGRV
jgi:hypothetical protein